MISQTLPLPDVVYLWDLILAQPPSTATSTPRLTFLVDICTSMILRLRPRLIIAGNRYKGGLWSDEAEGDSLDGGMGEGFVEGMALIQSYPIEAVGVSSIIQGAWWLLEKQKRELEALERRRTEASSYSIGRMGLQLRELGWGVARPAPEEQPGNTSRNSKTLRFGSFDMSDAAARLSKARSNLTAVAMDAWSRPSRSSSETTPPASPSLFNPRGWGLKSGEDKLVDSAQTKIRSDTPPTNQTSPTTSSSLSPPAQSQSLLSRDPSPSPSIPSRFLHDRSPSMPLTPSPNAKGPRPLILSNHRVTRDSFSRQSSISSNGTAPIFGSDAESTPSRRILLRGRRTITSPSPPSSSASSMKSPRTPFPPLPNRWDLNKLASGEMAVAQDYTNDQTIVSPTSSRPLSPSNESTASVQFTSDAELSEPTPLAVKDSLGPRVIRPSRLRVKRSLPALDAISVDSSRRVEARKSPLTPRPPLPPENGIVRRPSPKPRRTRKVSRGAQPEPASDAPYLASEEEGIKADDEEDYTDILTSYSTDFLDDSLVTS